MTYKVRSIYPRPYRRYQNLNDFRKQETSSSKTDMLNDPTFWPCLNCGGVGRIYDPDEEPCPIEGYKMVGRVDCPSCKGSGRSTKQIVKQSYIKWREGYLKDLANYRYVDAVIRSAAKKLTREEFDLVSRYSIIDE